MKVGDWVRITNPLPEYRGLYKLKDKIGKIILIQGNSYRIYFKEYDDNYLFFDREIKKISEIEVFMEEL